MARKAPHDVLSECLERLESGQGGVEELLAQHPALRPEIEPLLRLAAQLRAQPRLRAPERLRRDPLWCRGLATSAQPPTPAALSDYAARAVPSTTQLEPHDALAMALERWERGEPGVEAVLAEHPEVQPLVELAVELWSLPPVQAPARLRQDPLWRRAASPAEAPATPVSLPLWAAARREEHAPAARFTAASRTHRKRMLRTLSRLAAGVGGAGLALLLAGSLATSTATSLPDEPLYPVKRLVEDAQLAVAPPQARLEIRLQRAQERMKETREMVERDRADVVASLATDYVREVDAVRTELQNPQGQAPAPEQVGRVITRLEANEQMLGAIVQRVPEPARPAVARAVEVSRPESVTTSTVTTSSGAASAPAPAAVAPPAPPEPAAVAPAAPAEPAPPAAIVPAAAPTFGAVGPASVALPGRSSSAQSTTGSAPATEPRRVTIPGGSGAAPAILPPAGSATAPQQNPASTTSGGTRAGTAGAVTSSSSSGTASGTTTAPSLGAPNSTGAATGGSPSAAPARSSGAAAGTTSAPASVTSGSASPATTGSAGAASSPAAPGGAGTTGPASTQRAPSFDAPPAQATPAPSPTPVYQLLPPAATPTRTAP
ncbi:MAG TPA: DUF5667 domain-containing protein [Chloroflexota bacterium]|nr:DUF5667 domain-containing protein [Chloroflexota bacterium]